MISEQTAPNSPQVSKSIGVGKPSKLLFGILFAILTIILLILIKSEWRLKVRNFIIGNDRKILATLREDLAANGQSVLVFKVKEKGNLYIEFYTTKLMVKDENTDPTEPQPPELLQKIELSGSIDGFVNFMGQATNLAVANLDEDPSLEVIVPFYNQEFSPNLEIIKYNPDFHKFEVQQNFDIPKSLLDSVSRSE